MQFHKCTIMLKKTKRGYLPVNELAKWFCEFANSDAFNRTHTFNEYQVDKFLNGGFDVEVRE